MKVVEINKEMIRKALEKKYPKGELTVCNFTAGLGDFSLGYGYYRWRGEVLKFNIYFDKILIYDRDKIRYEDGGKE